MWVFCLFVYGIHAWHFQKSEEGIRSPETRVTDHCEAPCEVEELNPGSLQEEQLFLTAKPCKKRERERQRQRNTQREAYKIVGFHKDVSNTLQTNWPLLTPPLSCPPTPLLTQNFLPIISSFPFIPPVFYYSLSLWSFFSSPSIILFWFSGFYDFLN